MATVPEPEPPALEHLYEVKIGPDDALLGVFLEVTGLGIEYDVIPYSEGGRNDFIYQHRGRLKQTNLTLKAGVTSQTVLLDWLLKKPPKPQDLQLIFKTADNRVLRSFSFKEAVPVKWTGPNASIGANSVATESLEIAHRGLNAGSGGA